MFKAFAVPSVVLKGEGDPWNCACTPPCERCWGVRGDMAGGPASRLGELSPDPPRPPSSPLAERVGPGKGRVGRPSRPPPRFGGPASCRGDSCRSAVYPNRSARARAISAAAKCAAAAASAVLPAGRCARLARILCTYNNSPVLRVSRVVAVVASASTDPPAAVGEPAAASETASESGTIE